MSYETSNHASTNLGRGAAASVSWGSVMGDYWLMHLDASYESPLAERVERAIGEVIDTAQPVIEAVGACVLAARGVSHWPGRLAAIVK